MRRSAIKLLPLQIAFLSCVGFMSIASAAAGQDLVIGQVTSLSGSNGADLGQGLQLGLRLAIDKANANGGIYGKKLRLVSKDDKYQPNETVRLTQELIEQDKPIALAGYRGTANTLALMNSKLLTDAKLALVGTLTGAQEVRGAPNIFHVRTSYQNEISQIVEQLGRMGIQRIGLLYVDDAFGKTGRDAVEKTLALHSQKPVAIASYDKAPDKVVATMQNAAAILAASPSQAVVIVAVGEPVYEFIKRFRALAPAPRLVSISVVNPDAVTQSVGVELARGIGFSQVFPFPYNDRVSLVRDYRKQLTRFAPDAMPSYFSLEGYVNGLVLLQAIKNAGIHPSREKVLQALHTMPEIDLGGFFIKFNPATHNGSAFSELTVIGVNGRLQR